MATTVNSTLRFDNKPSGILSALAGFFTMMSAAIEASAAVQSGRRPSAEALERLGMADAEFPALPYDR